MIMGLAMLSSTSIALEEAVQSLSLAPLGKEKEFFSIYACVDGWEESEGYASIDAFMKTTFCFIFNKPEPEILPEEASLPESVRFVLFLEGRANAWAHGPLPSFSSGYATASGSFSTEIVSASASISAFFPNPYFPFDVYDYDPQQGYRRVAKIKSVEISSGQGDYELRFSGLASTENFNAMSVGNAYARTGIVVLSGIDPLGVPEVGDNEFVYTELSKEKHGVVIRWARLIVPVKAKVVTGFSTEDSIMEWLKEKFDWSLSRPLPYPFPKQLGYYSGTEIFPRFQDPHDSFEGIGLAFSGEYLPEKNRDFGERKIILIFSGKPVHEAKIEVFYPTRGNLHPPKDIWPGFRIWLGTKNINDLTESNEIVGIIRGMAIVIEDIAKIVTPNWFYYYTQVYPHVTFYAEIANSEIIGAVLGGFTTFYIDNNKSIDRSAHSYITDLGLERKWIPLFMVVNGRVQRVDWIKVKGIHSFVCLVEHESIHKILLNNNIHDFWNPQDDIDLDGLLNEWEIAHNLDPTNADTTDTYPGYLSGDVECICDIETYGRLLKARDYWMSDWADEGLQFGTPPPTDEFPWIYRTTGKNRPAEGLKLLTSILP
ncbi:MAG: hypothetical protein NZ937_07875 [Armatimonadetes bacterium]|nr:hypothetical protein [Armatimonadota bacterium]